MWRKGAGALFLAVLFCGSVLVPLLPGFIALAAPPNPTLGTATVDGDISEWNLVTDFFGNMYRAFKADFPLEAKYYLRYDCATETMYVLVQQTGTAVVLEQPNNAWATKDGAPQKVYTGASIDDGTPPDFAWVGPFGTEGSETTATGYEASFSIAPGSHTIVVHVEVFDSGGAQTAGSAGDGEVLEISCAGGGGTGSIQIIKNTVPDDAQNFTFSTTGLSPINFTLDDDADGALTNSRTYTSLSDGSYSVTEGAVAGFDLTNISCSGATNSTIMIGADSDFDSGDTSVSITLSSNENIVCTFTNTKNAVVVQYDFGDAPDGLGGYSYATLSASTGAKHIIGSGLLMGKKIDDESDGQPSLDAEEDDNSTKDEDGVFVPALILEGSMPSFKVRVKNPTSSEATVTCWIDYDGDSVFEDGERATATVPANTNMDVELTFPVVPAGAVADTGGETYLRCRLSTDGVLPPTGEASDGEVEDYLLKVHTTGNDEDTDNDKIPDSVESQQDLDEDGIKDFEDPDPHGYFYCLNNGQIVPGGSISVSGPGPVTILMDGSSGQYSFTITVPGVYVITVTPPPGTTLDLTYFSAVIFDPTGMPNPVVLGPGEFGATGFLAPGYPTTFYLSFALDTGDPIIINNNFPLNCGGSVGGDPPVWGDIMVFPTPEAAHGFDLNNDGDLDDTILRYKNISNGQITNTGVSVSNLHRDMDIYDDQIVFVYRGNTLLDRISSLFNPAGRIGVYNIKTGKMRLLGISGSRPSIYKNIISFSSGVVSYYDLTASKLIRTSISGNNQSVWDGMIAYEAVPDGAEQPEIYLYNIKTGAVIATAAVGSEPAIHAGRVAFETSEQVFGGDLDGDGAISQTVIRYFDIAGRKIFNTGVAGEDPAIYNNHIVFSQGKSVLYYNTATTECYSTGLLGTEPDIYGETITYYVWEQWQVRDMNLDGDRRDPIVGTHTISASDPVVHRAASATTPSGRIESAGITQLKLSATALAIRFEAMGRNIESAKLEIFDLTGRLIYSSQFETGSKLSWTLKRADGTRVANGVYIYRVTVRDAAGNILATQMKKLVVLR